MFKESSVCSHWVEMCKTPTECSRESAQALERCLLSLRHHQENRWARTNFRKYRNSLVDNCPYQGHLSIYFSKYTHTHTQKKFRAPPSAIHKFTHGSHYLNFKQFEWTRIRSTWDEIHLSKGNSSKKLLPISTIEITSQYAIVLSTYSWNPLVFLWGKRDYLAGNTALMWRRGRKKKKSVLMEVASCLWISMMCTMPLNPFLIWACFAGTFEP